MMIQRKMRRKILMNNNNKMKMKTIPKNNQNRMQDIKIKKR